MNAADRKNNHLNKSAAAGKNAAASVYRLKSEPGKEIQAENMQKREGENGIQSRFQTVGWMILLAVLFLALLIRLPYGFDWTDESYHVEIIRRLVQGDRLLTDTWEVHQFSALLGIPFLRVFLLARGGSTDGSLLYFRYVAVILQFLSSLYCFSVLERRYGGIPAVLVSAILLGHAHYAMNNFFYNPISLIATVLSWVCLVDACDRGGKRLLWMLSGLFCGISILGQPWCLISLPVWGVFWIRDGQERRKAGEKLGWIWFLAGLAGLGILICIKLFSGSSGKEILQNLRGILSDPDHDTAGIPLLLAQYLNAVRVLFGPVTYLVCAVFVLSVAGRAARKPALIRFATILSALVPAAAVLWIIPYDYPDYHKINLAAMAGALICPGLFVLSDGKKDPSVLLFFLGTALSIAVQIGSNTRVRASTGMMLPASMAGCLYLSVHLKSLFPGQDVRKIPERIAAGSFLMLAALIFGLRITAVYRDEPIGKLDTVLVSGPASGLRTTGEKAGQYERICQAVRQETEGTGTVLITNLLPFGYLLTDRVPATPSTYNMTADSAWLAEYYSLHPEREPDRIFCVAEPFGVSNAISLRGMEVFLENPEYDSRQLPEGLSVRKADQLSGSAGR